VLPEGALPAQLQERGREGSTSASVLVCSWILRDMGVSVGGCGRAGGRGSGA
jgi:hypothetical protein